MIVSSVCWQISESTGVTLDYFERDELNGTEFLSRRIFHEVMPITISVSITTPIIIPDTDATLKSDPDSSQL